MSIRRFVGRLKQAWVGRAPHPIVWFAEEKLDGTRASRLWYVLSHPVKACKT